MKSADIAVVQEYTLPIRSANDEAIFIKAAKAAAVSNHIVKPKGYTVSWHANPETEKHHFGPKHPMKPWRLTLTKSVVMAYGMNYAMDCYLSPAATMQELKAFHSEEYLDFLASIEPRDPVENPDLPHNLGGFDCPIFPGIFNYCALHSGASLDAVRKLNSNQSQIAVNWSGGLHHAKKSGASGFCFMNDIVLAIIELLRYHPRVLYIDIDVHHGDGVEEAFWSTGRVMTVSFHKYDGSFFFPGTGALEDTGPKSSRNLGAHHSINVPLNDGIDDDSYVNLFQTIINRCLDTFRPSAIVLQCGADSLAGDRIGPFNLHVQGHGRCVEFCKGLGIPLLLLGGGGYTPRNVARAWANETAIAIGCESTLNAELPEHTAYRSHFRQTTLYPTVDEMNMGNRPNKNSKKRLEEIVESVFEQLRFVEHAPSVKIDVIPSDLERLKQEVEDEMREEQERREANESERQTKEDGTGVAGEHA